jgi:hypothetical protein
MKPGIFYEQPTKEEPGLAYTISTNQFLIYVLMIAIQQSILILWNLKNVSPDLLQPYNQQQTSQQLLVSFAFFAWLKERISQHYTMAKDTEVDKRKHSIIPPAPKKSFLDRAPNRLSRTIA